eukprot:TRINITY_DN6803_c0_g2_i1.p1 TRINITY_DN6803_c0_g2~~TRINITY_DN6803_c0_g2_i1.p1  ORF type:complete len:813 (+),score=209.64 TRINITY_DN6803_c0_g2_i1:36-2474(+)
MKRAPMPAAVDSTRAVSLALQTGSELVAQGRAEFAYALYYGVYNKLGHALAPELRAVLQLRMCDGAIAAAQRGKRLRGLDARGAGVQLQVKEHLTALAQLDREHCLPPDLLLQTAAVRVRVLAAGDSDENRAEVLRELQAAMQDAEAFHRPQWTRYFKTRLAVHLLVDMHYAVAEGRVPPRQSTRPAYSHADDGSPTVGAPRAEQLAECLRRGAVAVKALLPAAAVLDAHRRRVRREARWADHGVAARKRRRVAADWGFTNLSSEIESSDGTATSDEEEEEEEEEEDMDGDDHASTSCKRKRRVVSAYPADALPASMAEAVIAVLRMYEGRLVGGDAEESSGTGGAAADSTPPASSTPTAKAELTLTKHSRVEARDDGVWYPGVVVHVYLHRMYFSILFDGDKEAVQVPAGDIRLFGAPASRKSHGHGSARAAAGTSYEDGGEWVRLGMPPLPETADGAPHGRAGGGLAVLARAARAAVGTRRVRGGAIAELAVAARDALPSTAAQDPTAAPAEVGQLLAAALVRTATLDVAGGVQLVLRAARAVVAAGLVELRGLVHLAAYPPLVLSGRAQDAHAHLTLAAASPNAVLRRTAAACRLCVAPACAGAPGRSLAAAWEAFVQCCEAQDAAGVGASPSMADDVVPAAARPTAEEGGWNGFHRVYATAVAATHGVTAPPGLCPEDAPALFHAPCAAGADGEDGQHSLAALTEARCVGSVDTSTPPTPLAAHRGLWACLRAGDGPASEDEARYRARVARGIAASPGLAEAAVVADLDRRYPQQGVAPPTSAPAPVADIDELCAWVPGGARYFPDTT